MTQTAPPPYVPQIRLYQNWLHAQRGLCFDSYDALWRWSITDLDAFWQSIWDFFALQSPTPHTAVLSSRNMPGASGFPVHRSTTRSRSCAMWMPRTRVAFLPS
jgi:acetoacetyl-CoA synthetase